MGPETKLDKLVSSAIHQAVLHNNVLLMKISFIFNC